MKIFDEMMSGLDDVEEFLAGKRDGFRMHAPEGVDVKRIRRSLKMTQARFSETFGFTLDAVKHWEGGRRKPEAAARTLLTVIHKNPVAVLSAICPATPLSKPRRTGAVSVSKKRSRSASHLAKRARVNRRSERQPA